MKYLSLDWGMKKIGLAISAGMIASPFKTLTVSSLDQAIDQVIKVVRDENIDLVVIGKPEGEMGKKVESAIKELIKKGVKVEKTDETLSTRLAQEEMLILGKSQKSRADDNKKAAAIILQQFLDSQDEKV